MGRVWEAKFWFIRKTTSYANSRRHWRWLNARKQGDKAALRMAWEWAEEPTPTHSAQLQINEHITLPCPAPVTVQLTRSSSRPYDNDNLEGALKYFRDELCRCLGLRGDAPRDGVLFLPSEQIQTSRQPTKITVEMWVEGKDNFDG